MASAKVVTDLTVQACALGDLHPPLAAGPVAALAQVVTHALARGPDDPAAIALLLEQKRAPAPTAALRACVLPASARCEAPAPDLMAYATARLMESAA